MKLYISLILILINFGSLADNFSTEDFIANIKTMPDTKEKVDILNNQVDKLLKPEPTVENCKKAEKLALQAASISEKLNYKIGMARSYEQLKVIYGTLDYQIKYLRYKGKAALVDRSEELKKQKEETEKIKQEIDELAKDNITNKELIEKKQIELLEKQNALNETSGQLDRMTAEAERLATKNKLLEKDKKIKELEVIRQRLQKYFILSLLAVFLFLAIILFKQFKNKQRSAKELAEKNEIITAEKKRSDELLLNILPLETANELKANGKATTREYEMVTVMFTDFKDFTQISEKLTPKDLVDEIDTCYCAFDSIIEKYGIEKIKTIGDAYLCAYGIAQNFPKDYKHNPANVIDAAFEIVDFMREMNQKRLKEGKPFFRIRVGIHSGPLVAGVVGRKKFAYDIWGDTVNTAARMEQHGEPDKINISATTYKMVVPKYNFTHRGKIEAKNKGNIDMYFVDSKKS